MTFPQKKFLLVGRNSFIGRHFLEASRDILHVDAISFRDVDAVNLTDYDCVFNLSYQPEYFHQVYDESIDFALRMAKRVALSSAHFMMISTRRVYGTQSPFPVSENAALNPTGFYGVNSSVTEVRVQELLGDRCTIVRGANVFGYEPGRHTFCGLAMSYLLQSNRLSFDFSPFTLRDFIPVEHFGHVLVRLARLLPSGIFNIGSGRSVPVGQLALWIMQGFGQGEMLVTGSQPFDAFQLDISKLEQVLGPQPDLTRLIQESSIRVGERMREYRLKHGSVQPIAGY